MIEVWKKGKPLLWGIGNSRKGEKPMKNEKKEGVFVEEELRRKV